MKLIIAGCKNSESLYISKSVRKNGKSTTAPVMTLGRVSDLCEKLNLDREGVIAWGKEQAKIMTQKENMERERAKINLPLNTQRRIEKYAELKFDCGYLFLLPIFDLLGPKGICTRIKSGKVRNRSEEGGARNTAPYRYTYDLYQILSDLVYTRILYPASKRSSYEEAKKFVLHKDYEEHDIYNALTVLAENSDFIQSQVYRNSMLVTPRDTTILYYDVTNYYFEIEEPKDDKQYGYSKEHRPNPIVQMGMFVDTEGLPLSFSIFEGNRNEQTSLSPLEKKILKDFGCSNFIYCCDAGLASDTNRLLNSVENRHFVVVQSIRRMKGAEREQTISPRGFRYLGSDRPYTGEKLGEAGELLYKELPYTSRKTKIRMIVYYSPKYAAYARALRESRVTRAKRKIDSGMKSKMRGSRSEVNRYIKEDFIDEDGVVRHDVFFEINEDLIYQDAELDGLYALCTDMTDRAAAEILEISQGRWQIESDFRLLKTDLKTRPVYVSREDHIKSHFLICYLSLLVFRLLEKKLNNKYTSKEILDCLRDLEMTAATDSFGNDGFCPAYNRTDLTDDLHRACAYDTFLDYEFIYKSDLRKTIAKSGGNLRYRKK